jgi:hypothetical protein
MAERFLELTRMKYADQAKWYLNGFWTSGAEKEAEFIWKSTQKFIELDDKRKKEGTKLKYSKTTTTDVDLSIIF